MSDVLVRPRRDAPTAAADDRHARHAAGAAIYAPGPSDHLYRVEEGLVRLHVLDDEGEGFTVRYVKPGDWFGEEVLAGLPHAVFAEAVTDAVTIRVRPSELAPHEHAEVASRLAVALHGLYGGMRRLGQRPLLARVAAELLELRDSALSVDDGGRRAVLVTHDALAASVGSVRETVTKAIGELARAGAVEAGYRRIALTDEARLRALADGTDAVSAAA